MADNPTFPKFDDLEGEEKFPISLRVPKTLHLKVKAKAEREGRSLTHIWIKVMDWAMSQDTEQ